MTSICKNCGKPIFGRVYTDIDLNLETGEIEANYIHPRCVKEYLVKLERELI